MFALDHHTIILMGLPIVGFIWACLCNRRTYLQRKRLITVIYASSDWSMLSKQLDRVSYDRHMLALLIGRDPRKLYHPKLIELLDQT